MFYETALLSRTVESVINIVRVSVKIYGRACNLLRLPYVCVSNMHHRIVDITATELYTYCFVLEQLLVMVDT